MRVGTSTQFISLRWANIEAKEIHCAECGEHIGFVYRRKKRIPQERVEYKIITNISNENYYLYQGHD